jgi:hypothetical protein
MFSNRLSPNCHRAFSDKTSQIASNYLAIHYRQIAIAYLATKERQIAESIQ